MKLRSSMFGFGLNFKAFQNKLPRSVKRFDDPSTGDLFKIFIGKFDYMRSAGLSRLVTTQQVTGEDFTTCFLVSLESNRFES